MLEGHRHQPPDRLIAIGPVVVAAHAEAVALQVANGDLEGLGPAVSQQPPHLGAAAGGQQRHTLGGGEAVVERLHPFVDPLASMLPRLVEPLPIQLTRVDTQHLAAEPLGRLDLDPSRAPQPTGCLDRAHVTLERLGAGHFLQVGDFLLGGAGLERIQERPGGELGARIGAQQRRAALLARSRVEALEHRLHLLGRGDTVQAGCGGGAAQEPAW
jgi:hypothetical protein